MKELKSSPTTVTSLIGITPPVTAATKVCSSLCDFSRISYY